MAKARPTHILGFIPFFLLLVTGILVLTMYVMGGMNKVSAWYLFQSLLPLVGLVCLLFSVARAIVKKKVDSVVKLTGIASVLAIVPALLLVFPVAYPASLQHTTPSATVRLPANGPLLVAWGGDTLAANYHAITPDQRWAYDLLVEPYLSGSTTLTDYGCYGIQVVAPASGVVAIAHDGEPDMEPGRVSNNIDAPEGNYVVIQMDQTGTYLLIAHLMPGSVIVSAGQRVEEGQVIGQCGNSGNTSEPHIHIHHQRQDPSQYPINFAEGLPLYFRDHDGPLMPEGGFEIVDGVPVALGMTVTHNSEP